MSERWFLQRSPLLNRTAAQATVDDVSVVTRFARTCGFSILDGSSCGEETS